MLELAGVELGPAGSGLRGQASVRVSAMVSAVLTEPVSRLVRFAVELVVTEDLAAAAAEVEVGLAAAAGSAVAAQPSGSERQRPLGSAVACPA